MYDAIVIGGGPAGLAAALTLGRVRRSTLVIDSGEPRNATSPAMHNFLSRDGTPPSELRAIARDQLTAYADVELRAGRAVGVVRRSDETFEVQLESGAVERARRIVLASGVTDDLPPIDGLRDHWGTAVLHCPYCHGYEFRDSPLAVIGATPASARLALHVTRLSDDVVLCTNGDPSLDASMRHRLEQYGVGVRDERIVRVAGAPEHAVRFEFESGEPVVRSAAFVAPVLRQQTTFAAQLGCTLLDDGSIRVDDMGRTNVAGVYAAGDMARRESMHAPAAAVMAAAAAGLMAGIAVDQSLVTQDFDLPDPLAGHLMATEPPLS